MKTKIYYLLLISTMFFNSCSEYLEVPPSSGTASFKTTEDYEKILYNPIVWGSKDFGIVSSSADDYALIVSINVNATGETSVSATTSAYIFAKYFYTLTSDPVHYTIPYKAIFHYNTIINFIDNSTGGTLEDKALIKSEAYLGRAYEYFNLVNLFGKQYDASSAKSDLGVSLFFGTDYSDVVPPRATVQEVYDFVIDDINKAIQYLPKTNIKFRATKSSAFGVLARVYLQQSNYEKALEYAEKALQENNYLADYATLYANNTVIKKGGLFPVVDNSAVFKAMEPEYNKEQLYLRLHNVEKNANKNSITVDLEALFLENEGDVRKLLFASNKTVKTNGIFPNQGVSTAEVYLIRAECKARSGLLEDALKDLNYLRKKRILEDDYFDIVSNDKNQILTEIFKERRKEFFMSGNRFFDLKRLNKEPQFATTITHVFKRQSYILEPNSENYVFPIPLRVTQVNKNMEQNPRTDIAPQ